MCLLTVATRPAWRILVWRVSTVLIGLWSHPTRVSGRNYCLHGSGALLLWIRGGAKGPLMRKAVDVYALGMLIYEVWPSILDLQGKKLSPDTGFIRERPFYKVPIHSIMLGVPCGGRPQRPSSTAIPIRIWEMSQECWSEDPTQRLTVNYITAMCMNRETRNRLPVRLPPVGFSSRSRG